MCTSEISLDWFWRISQEEKAVVAHPGWMWIYSSNFIEDIAIIANSDFYFQFKGGGIGLLISAIIDLNQVQKSHFS